MTTCKGCGFGLNDLPNFNKGICFGCHDFGNPYSERRNYTTNKPEPNCEGCDGPGENSNCECECGPSYEDDAVNPSHYKNRVPGIECIDATKHFDFCLGNAIKYIWRAGIKDKSKEVEDLMKAIWYIEKKIEMLGGQNG
jgi:hypothetical protein